MRNGIIAFIIIFTLTSCKTRGIFRKKDRQARADSSIVINNGSGPRDANEPVRDKFSFYEHVLIPPKFEQIKISSKVNVETGSFIPTLDAVIYIEKDKKVWMNLQALLFTVARGMGRRSCLHRRQDREPAAGRGPSAEGACRADC